MQYVCRAAYCSVAVVLLLSGAVWLTDGGVETGAVVAD